MTGRVDKRLAELGIVLPQPPSAAANYVPFVQVGPLVFISGQTPRVDGKVVFIGKVGRDVAVAEATAAARLCALNVLAQLRVACDGDLDRVVRCVRLTGYVNGDPDFAAQPQVVNGASDLMTQVFGERGRHARTAVGAGSLPAEATVEIEAIFEIED
jgi:enamine deaminase RidA (YjgF/YER057c/UK114 family)